MNHAFGVEIALPFDAALERVQAALAEDATTNQVAAEARTILDRVVARLLG